MSKHDYLGFEDTLDKDDYGFILDAKGNLKGIWVPEGAEDEHVPEAIVNLIKENILESFFRPKAKPSGGGVFGGGKKSSGPVFGGGGQKSSGPVFGGGGQKSSGPVFGGGG